MCRRGEEGLGLCQVSEKQWTITINYSRLENRRTVLINDSIIVLGNEHRKKNNVARAVLGTKINFAKGRQL